MTGIDWPPFDIANPATLARFAVADEVRRLSRLPQNLDAEGRLTAIWEGLRGHGIVYANAREGTGPAGQVIRPPGEVLDKPGSGTCVDVALVLATACRNAELLAAVILLEPVDGSGPNHALVLVSRTGRWPVGSPSEPWQGLPDGFWEHVREDPGMPGRDLLVLDPIGLTTALGSRRILGPDTDLTTAATNARGYLTSGAWRVLAVVPITLRPDAYRPAPVPEVNPLRQIYWPPQEAPSPLQSLRPEYQLTRFQDRDEFTILLDLCERAVESGRNQIAVLHGVGGSGKTRLALEVAERMRGEGWYAGVLTEQLDDPASWTWLATVRAPLLVIVDYADGRLTDAMRLFTTLRDREGSPAVVILTARSADGGWLEELTGALKTNGFPAVPEVLDRLPATLADPARIYRATLAALDSTRGMPHQPAPGVEWTTLDLVLLGWLDGQPDQDAGQPTTQHQLYKQVMDHEIGYWAKTYRDLIGQPKARPNRHVLKQAGAIATLRQPSTTTDLNNLLRAVPELAEAPEWRDNVACTLATVLQAREGEPMAIRPDPVADFHLLITLGKHPELLDNSLPTNQPASESLQPIWILNRAGQSNEDTATRLLAGSIGSGRAPWKSAAVIAQLAPGPSRRALEQLVSQPECALPLEELSDQIDTIPTGAYQLGLLIDERRLTDEPDPARRPGLLLRVSHRRSLAGDRAGALAAIEEAVTLYRQLAQANPAVFTPDLAGSLNNLSVQRSDTGDRAGALAAIEEAVTLYRQLAQANPAVFTPDLIRSTRVEADLRSDSPFDEESTWSASATATPPPFKALINIAAAQWYQEQGSSTQAEHLVQDAARAAEVPNIAALNHLGEIRRTVRATIQSWDLQPETEMPAWATCDISPTLIALAEGWAGTRTPAAQADVIRQHAATLTEAGFADDLAMLDYLFPGNSDLEALRVLQEQVQDIGVDATVEALEAFGRAIDIVDKWLATPTWTDSVDYLREHLTELDGPECRVVLEERGDDEASQHLAILDLTQAHRHGQQLFSWLLNILADPQAAASQVLDSLQVGNLNQFLKIVRANPRALDLPGTGPFIIAVLLTLQQQVSDGLAMWNQQASGITNTQRKALGIRLKGLIQHTANPETRETLNVLLRTVEKPSNSSEDPGTDH